MEYTSAEAAKLLLKLRQDGERISTMEENAKTFLASVGEDVESVRPEYDYDKVKEEISELEAKIRKIKHAINLFNTVTVIPEFGMTVDEMLVYIPQLTKKRSKLKEMAETLPKIRYQSSIRSPIIDYQYINYDPAKVKTDLDKVTEELYRAQLALDAVNHSKSIEIDI